jgi:aconitate decarboxylase
MTEASLTDHTLLLADFLRQQRYEDLSPEVVEQAKRSILNSLGCGLGYAVHPPAEKVFATLQSQPASENATIIGRTQRMSVENAILINGIALTTADFDDTHLKTVIHPSGTPLAALLSWAEEHHMTGKDFILSFVCGVEAQLAVGIAIHPAHYKDGW